MLRRLAAFWCALVVIPAMPGAGPDDQFIAIYNVIQQADKASDKIHAYRLFTEAREGLKQLQQGYPTWNERVINYRLRYCADKLTGLQDVADQAARKPELAGAGALTAPSPELPANEVLTQFNDLNTRIHSLSADKQLLEARLREALSAQPAPIDPRELQAAVEKVSALQVTNRALISRLESQEAERRNLVDKVVADEAQKALAETRRQLAGQKQAAARLEQERSEVEGRLKHIQENTLKPLKLENQTLKDQVVELKSDTDKGRQVAEMSARLTRVQLGLEEMKRANERLTGERTALEKQVGDLKIRQSEEGIVRIAKLETELAVARADAGRNTLRADELVTALTQEKQARTQLRQENLTLEQRVAQLTAQSAADTDALKNLQTTLAGEKTERAAVEARLRFAEVRFKALATGPSDPAAADFPEQNARLQGVQAELARLRESLLESTRREIELQTALAQESSLRSRLQRERTGLELQLADATAQLASRPIARPSPNSPTPGTRTLETKVRQLEKERDDLKGRLTSLSQHASRRLVELRALPAVTPRERAAEFRRER